MRDFKILGLVEEALPVRSMHLKFDFFCPFLKMFETKSVSDLLSQFNTFEEKNKLFR